MLIAYGVILVTGKIAQQHVGVELERTQEQYQYQLQVTVPSVMETQSKRSHVTRMNVQQVYKIAIKIVYIIIIANIK